MAVRQAAAVKWAQRRAAEARQKDAADDEGVAGSDDSPSPARKGRSRRPRVQSAGSQVAASWDAAAFGMYNPYAAAMFPNPALAGFPGMYPPPYGMLPGPMSPFAMYPGMGAMPGFFPGAGDMSPPMGKVRTTGGGGKKAKKQDMEVSKSKSVPVEGTKTSSRKKGKAKDGTPVAGGSPVGKGQAAETERQVPDVDLDWEEVRPKIVETARGEASCRWLLKQMDAGDAAVIEEICAAVSPEATALASEAHVNVVLQKLLDVGTQEQKKSLVGILQKDLVKNATDTYGCRVVQKMLEVACRDALVQMATELNDHVIVCIESMHGNHVIQKCVERMPPDSVGFIVQAIEEQTCTMASHMYGCRVVQRLLEHCALGRLSKMLDDIVGQAATLAQDPYGNYVVQHVLQFGRKDDKAAIIAIITGDVVTFSKNKCSSNVVDKCFEVSTIGEHAQALEKERAALMQAVLGEPGAETPPLQQMTEDRFGNYIVQRVIEHSRGAERERLLQQLQDATPQLKSSVRGKRIYATLQKELGLTQAKAAAS